jgi:DNA polymerase-3 subunit gamma/tau
MPQKKSPRNRPAANATPAIVAAGGPAPGYQVVARRYRPQRFDELVGQEHVARGLAGAIQSGRVGHAYLFTGARGVGKTSAARIFAKALECTAGTGPEPCNACDKCQGIAAGQDVDVVEVDAASNRGIDEIRQLRQNVAVRPARGRHRIYIIDEVHMLTREAFNALLKTLEEPPAHVKFVLCTTEPEKLPITILSRCQRFDFHSVDADAIARRLAQIVAAEGAEATPEALALIARRAAGSMRDSQSLLEQLLGSATGPVGLDEVHAVIGTGREEIVGRVVANVFARDARGGLEALDAALAGGADPGGVLEQVLAALRDALLASVGCGPEMLHEGAGLGVDLAAAGRTTGAVTLLAMLQIVDHALSRMRTSGHAQVLAEMAIVRLASIDDLDDLAEAVDRMAGAAAAQSAGQPPRAAGPAAARPPAPAAAPAPVDGREKKTTGVTPGPAAGGAAGRASAEAAPAPARTPDALTPAAATAAAAMPLMSMPLESMPPAAVPAAAAAVPPAADAVPPAADAVPPAADAVPPAAAIEPAAVPPAALDSCPPLDLWRQAAEQVGGIAAEFAGLATAAAWRDDALEVSLPASATGGAAFLKRPEVAAGLARALGAATGRTVRLAIAVAAAAPAPRPAAAAERPRGGSQATLVREALDHPLVSHARTVFDAAILKVEPPRPGRAAAVPAAAATAAVAAGGGTAGDEDERDHSADGDAPPFDPDADGGADG